MVSSIFLSSTRMSKSIVIIDDRPNRPSLHLPEDAIRQLHSLPNVRFASSIGDLDLKQFDVIAIHRSYVVRAKLFNELDKLIKDYSKYLILFSGGVSQQTISERGHKATIGSEVFYSSNLIPFCQDIQETESIQLYKLLYGINSWELPILMRLRQLYWMDPEEENGDVEDEREDIEDTLGISSYDELNNRIAQLARTV